MEPITKMEYVKVVIDYVKLVKMLISVLLVMKMPIEYYTINNVYAKRDIMNIMANVLNQILLLHQTPLQKIHTGDV